MSWSIGYDERWHRDVGYGVPAFCDHPGCKQAIDRGLPYVCGGQPFGGEHGCGLFFCAAHRHTASARRDHAELCGRCMRGKSPYKPTPDDPAWIRWKLDDESWAQWRDENPEAVAAMRADPRVVPPCHNRPAAVDPRAGWFETGRTADGRPVLRYRHPWFEFRCTVWEGSGIGPNGESYPIAHHYECRGCPDLPPAGAKHYATLVTP